MVLAGAGLAVIPTRGDDKTPTSLEAPALVGDLTRVTSWRGNTYAASGTGLAQLRNDREWLHYRDMPGRISAIAGGTHSLAVGGSGFLWVMPGKKKIPPALIEISGTWVALSAKDSGWVAVSQEGGLVVFSETGVEFRHQFEEGFRPNDVAEIWNQWWVVGQKRGQSHILTATSPAGPWTEAQTGGKAPAMRVVGFDRFIVVFGADGSAFRAVEGEAWEPCRGFEALTNEPPVSVFASPQEGFVALTPDGLVQSRDGHNWVRLAYQDDPYGSRALLHGDLGTVLISQSWTEAGLVLRREPVTPYATFLLAQAFANGEGVPLDPKRALELYRKAAVAGVHRAQVDLAFLIASGQVPAAQTSEASAWYLLLCGEEGLACEPEEAFRRIEALALKGRAEAQGILAVMLRLGFGTKPNSIEATAWTQIAEEQRANLYALDWYADVDDKPEEAKVRADALRAKISRAGATAHPAPVSGTGD
ncbi:MAG: tetratricopeptide repeat protein [Opitutaceae bacterium]|nr:tetratricopeptide repeat protein [Opitutaceae bacterium]